MTVDEKQKLEDGDGIQETDPRNGNRETVIYGGECELAIFC